MSKIYFSLFIFLFSLSFVSCMSDDDDKVDDEWKDYQTKTYDDISVLSDAAGDRIYAPLKSESGNGSVYWKTSDFITNRMTGDFSQKQPEVYPKTKSSPSLVKPSAITDTVVVRYEGWYYNKAGEFIIFDYGTERITEYKPPYTGSNNNTTPAKMLLSGVVDGFRTVLMDMVVNEERVVCIPANMGYGSAVTSTNVATIPAYTTLFFDVKLLKIISGNGTVIADGTITTTE